MTAAPTRRWIRSLAWTGLWLIVGAAFFLTGADVVPGSLGKHQGVAAFPGLVVLLIWSPGLLANHILFDGVLEGLALPGLPWVSAFAVSLAFCSPVLHRLHWSARPAKDRWFLGALLLALWAVVSDLALGQSRTNEGDQYLFILVVGLAYLAALGVHVWRSGGPKSSPSA